MVFDLSKKKSVFTRKRIFLFYNNLLMRRIASAVFS